MFAKVDVENPPGGMLPETDPILSDKSANLLVIPIPTGNVII